MTRDDGARRPRTAIPDRIEKAVDRDRRACCRRPKSVYPRNVRTRQSRACSNTWSVVGLISFVFLTASGPAYAYVDPGSVSLAIQGIVAALAGAALTWKHWYWRLRSFLGRNRKPSSKTDDYERNSRAPGNADTPPRG